MVFCGNNTGYYDRHRLCQNGIEMLKVGTSWLMQYRRYFDIQIK